MKLVLQSSIIFFDIIDLSEFSFNITDYNRVSESHFYNTKEKKNYNQSKPRWNTFSKKSLVATFTN